MRVIFKDDAADAVMMLCREHDVSPFKTLNALCTLPEFEALFCEAVELVKNDDDNRSSK